MSGGFTSPGAPGTAAAAEPALSTSGPSPPTLAGESLPLGLFSCSPGSVFQDGSAEPVPLPQRTGLLHSRVVARFCKYPSWIKSVHHSLPHLQTPKRESSHPPLCPLAWLFTLVEVRSLCARSPEQRDGFETHTRTVPTHKGSCTCFDLHFSNASGGISIS